MLENVNKQIKLVWMWTDTERKISLSFPLLSPKSFLQSNIINFLAARYKYAFNEEH